MARIMQIIDKRTDFTKSTVDLKLYQTGFISLTKLIDDVPGQTILNALAGQKVGYQFFHDLNNKQLEIKEHMDKYKPIYNSAISSKRKTVPNLIDFEYNWRSCVDYKAQIKSGDRADYRLLTKIVAAEKELYDYRFYAGDHIKRNCQMMAYWGKTKMYGSCVGSVRSYEIETRGSGDHGWSKISDGKYIKGAVYNYGARDKRLIDLIDVYKIPLGETDYVTIRVGGTVFKMGITKNRLNVAPDDGFFSLDLHFEVTQQGGDIHRFNGVPRVLSWTGKISTHFIKPVGVYDLNFFKTRVLI